MTTPVERDHVPAASSGEEAAFRSGFAAVLGRPNVGKSTLVNCLLGRKLSIVSRRPQTTRHRILGIKTTSTHQLVYIDTPGIHRAAGTALNRYMNRAAVSALDGGDVVVFVVEATRWREDDERVLRRIQDTQRPAIIAISKVDRVRDKSLLLPFIAEVSRRTGFDEVIPLSAHRRINTDLLETRIVDLLPVGAALFPDDQWSDRNEVFMSAELIREQLTERLNQELPYGLSVEIEGFSDAVDPVRVAAVVWVERRSHKPIVVGREGSTLKSVGTRARREIQSMLGRRVHLELWVKVRTGWSDDEQALMRMGYAD